MNATILLPICALLPLTLIIAVLEYSIQARLHGCEGCKGLCICENAQQSLDHLYTLSFMLGLLPYLRLDWRGQVHSKKYMFECYFYLKDEYCPCLLHDIRVGQFGLYRCILHETLEHSGLFLLMEFLVKECAQRLSL